MILTQPRFTPTWITITPSWAGDWAYTQGASFGIVVDENSKLAFDNPAFDITLTNTAGLDYNAGSIMTFAQVDNLYNYFPQTHSTLDALYLDGTSVSFDSSKVIDAMDGAAYRLELWNQYGATANSGCAFGQAVDGTVAGLAFSQSMRAQFTFRSLFSAVEW